jgi:hypothetical protein
MQALRKDRLLWCGQLAHMALYQTAHGRARPFSAARRADAALGQNRRGVAVTTHYTDTNV